MTGIRLNVRQLLRSHYAVPVLWDLVMLFLVSVNLSWFLLDALYEQPFINTVWASALPRFHNIYGKNFHTIFLQWDLIFVAIYVTEIVCRWGGSIVKKTYYRWWFYPFVHWYDVLGSIPLPSFHLLRLFRIVSLLYRLQRYQILDFSQTFLYRFLHTYFLALVEEVSDRVVLRVLDGIEAEIRAGNPVTHRMMIDVLGPNRDLLGQWLSHQLRTVLERSYLRRQEAVAHYIQHLVRHAIQDNAELARLAKTPVLGAYLIDSLENSIADITHGVLHRLASDLHSDDAASLIHEALDVLFVNISEPSGQASQLIENVLISLIDLLKSEVKKK
ncbi:MAG: hypothetical protein P8144_13295 [Gammaproteobacteria bacterium]